MKSALPSVMGQMWQKELLVGTLRVIPRYVPTSVSNFIGWYSFHQGYAVAVHDVHDTDVFESAVCREAGHFAKELLCVEYGQNDVLPSAMLHTTSHPIGCCVLSERTHS